MFMIVRLVYSSKLDCYYFYKHTILTDRFSFMECWYGKLLTLNKTLYYYIIRTNITKIYDIIIKLNLMLSVNILKNDS